MASLDSQDRTLLEYLQRDGKASTQELANLTNLSTSPCWRRIKRLEDTGVISGYVALVDPKAVGLHALAYVHVSLLDHTEATIKTFDSFVQSNSQIVECSSITGDSDYFLKVVARDPEGLEEFIMKGILALGIVRASMTNFALRQIKSSTAVPLAWG